MGAGLCVCGPVLCAASVVTCCESQTVKNAMYKWCKATTHGCCWDLLGWIVGSCVSPDGSDMNCCFFCTEEFMSTTGNRLERQAEKYLEEQNQKEIELTRRRSASVNSSGSSSVGSVGDMKEPETFEMRAVNALRKQGLATAADLRAFHAQQAIETAQAVVAVGGLAADAADLDVVGGCGDCCTMRR